MKPLSVLFNNSKLLGLEVLEVLLSFPRMEEMRDAPSVWASVTIPSTLGKSGKG